MSDNVIILYAGGGESALHDFVSNVDPDEYTLQFALTQSTDAPAEDAWQDGTVDLSSEVNGQWLVKSTTPAYDSAAGAYVLHRRLVGATESPRSFVATVFVIGADWST